MRRVSAPVGRIFLLNPGLAVWPLYGSEHTDFNVVTASDIMAYNNTISDANHVLNRTYETRNLYMFSPTRLAVQLDKPKNMYEYIAHGWCVGFAFEDSNMNFIAPE